MQEENPGSSVRRVPQQDRSAQRVDLILNTLAELIDEVGYGAITLSLIAKRAGMSGPGIYRYFDGLESVARALATRNLERLFSAIVRSLEEEDLEWEQSMVVAVGIYRDFFRDEPGFRWLRLGDPIDRNLIDTADSNRTVLARHLTELFSARFDVAPRDGLLNRVEVVVEIGESLMSRAFESDPAGEEFFVQESSAVVVSYLTDFLTRTLPPADESSEAPALS